MTRYPIEPLLALAGTNPETEQPHTLRSLTTIAGIKIGGHVYQMALHGGGLTAHMADQYAVKCLHIHPSLIWPDWFDDGLAANRCRHGHWLPGDPARAVGWQCPGCKQLWRRNKARRDRQRTVGRRILEAAA